MWAKSSASLWKRPRACLQSPLRVVWGGWPDRLPGGVTGQPSSANGSGSGLCEYTRCGAWGHVSLWSYRLAAPDRQDELREISDTVPCHAEPALLLRLPYSKTDGTLCVIDTSALQPLPSC
jgi:hypothetical protein